MKKSFYLILIALLLVSCKSKKRDVKNKTIEHTDKTITEINEKKKISAEADIDNTNLSILDIYDLDFGYEQYSMLYDNAVYSLSIENSSWKKDYASSYEINQNGFLVYSQNNNNQIILDHDITEICDFKYEHAYYYLNDSNLISLLSDGYYSETLNGNFVEYKIDGIKKAVMQGFDKGDNPLYTNPVPFVTKRGNSGIGEVIKISCRQPQNSISILPGYVNTNRQDLFYKNNRPKKIEIRDADSDYRVIANLSDVALFQKIKLKNPIKNFEIEILDVYKGTKYNDTCISGIRVNSDAGGDSGSYNNFMKEINSQKRIESFELSHQKNNDKSYGSEIRNGEICAVRFSLENPDFDIQFPECCDIQKFWNLEEKEFSEDDFLSYYDEIIQADMTGTFDNWYCRFKLYALIKSGRSIEEIRNQLLTHRISVFGKYSKNSEDNDIVIKSQNEVELGDFKIKLLNPINELSDSYHYIFNGAITDIKKENDDITVYVDDASVYVDCGI